MHLINIKTIITTVCCHYECFNNNGTAYQINNKTHTQRERERERERETKGKIPICFRFFFYRKRLPF